MIAIATPETPWRSNLPLEAWMATTFLNPNWSSKTYTKVHRTSISKSFHPLATAMTTWTSMNFLWGHLILVKRSAGESPVEWSGTWFQRKQACWTAIGHSCGEATSGQWIPAWSIMVRAMDIIVLMDRSARALWWWAPTPANLEVWWNWDRCSAKSLPVKAVPLSDIYVCTTTPISLHTFSYSNLALSVSCEERDDWNSTWM